MMIVVDRWMWTKSKTEDRSHFIQSYLRPKGDQYSPGQVSSNNEKFIFLSLIKAKAEDKDNPGLYGLPNYRTSRQKNHMTHNSDSVSVSVSVPFQTLLKVLIVDCAGNRSTLSPPHLLSFCHHMHKSYMLPINRNVN